MNNDPSNFDALWPTLPVPGEYDAMDACDQARWRGLCELAYLAGLAAQQPAANWPGLRADGK